MKWAYIDFEAALKTIPREAMKMGKELEIPFADQALVILKEAHKHKGELEYVFMSTIGIGKNKPIGESATANAIRRMIDL